VTIEIVTPRPSLADRESGVVRVRTRRWSRFSARSDGPSKSRRCSTPATGRLTATHVRSKAGLGSHQRRGQARAELIEETCSPSNVVEAAAFGALGADGIDEIHLASRPAPIAERR